MADIVVARRKDNGWYLSRRGWSPDINDARTFVQKANGYKGALRAALWGEVRAYFNRVNGDYFKLEPGAERMRKWKEATEHILATVVEIVPVNIVPIKEP